MDIHTQFKIYQYSIRFSKVSLFLWERISPVRTAGSFLCSQPLSLLFPTVNAFECETFEAIHSYFMDSFSLL